MVKFAGLDNPWVRIKGAKRFSYKKVPVVVGYNYIKNGIQREIHAVPFEKKVPWMRAKRAMKSYPWAAEAIAKVAQEHFRTPPGFIPRTYYVDGITIHVRDVDTKSSGYKDYMERYKSSLTDSLFNSAPISLSL
jgi:hypothetical protein